ncbi:MAG TPA: hypothetical protein V6D20_23870, partial [Candidatus Obscuribacterales bacterium]
MPARSWWDWHGHTNKLHPIVWRLAWPPAIVTLVSNAKVTINDLEMADIVLQFLVIANLVPLLHTHLAIWCDNTSAVSWSNRLSSKRSQAGQHLARALSLLICHHQTSPLMPFSIAGKDNDMANIASRSLKATGVPGNYDWPDHTFLTEFNCRFPLTQGASWLLYRLSDKLTTLVCSALQLGHQPMGSWLRPPTKQGAIGAIGKPTATTLEWTPSSLKSPETSKLSSSAALPLSYDLAEQ